jgi:endonuclease G, mitochondrial
MAQYPNATRRPGNNAGHYLGGPWRIVWHTTEGDTAEAAISAFAQHNSWPHFTVDEHTVFQHNDTSLAARSLEHPSGGVETNRWHAVQIELVAHAALAKPPALLARAARLARWLEQIHGIPPIWPNGYPLPANNGNDPGGHNRDAATWRTTGGHYGHCHVPDNHHWDPGLIDISALMAQGPGDFPMPSGDVGYG